MNATYDKADLVVMTSNHALFDYVLGSEEDRKRRPMSSAYRRRYKENELSYPSRDHCWDKEGPNER